MGDGDFLVTSRGIFRSGTGRGPPISIYPEERILPYGEPQSSSGTVGIRCDRIDLELRRLEQTKWYRQHTAVETEKLRLMRLLLKNGGAVMMILIGIGIMASMMGGI